MTVQGATAPAKMGWGMKILIGLAILVVGFFLMVAWGAQIERNQPPLSERVKTSCDEQYGSDTDRSKACQVALLASALSKAEDDKMTAARKGAGL
jgi:hypothetical protein